MSNFEINGGAVLTLWSAIVAERLGFYRHEALTLGRAVGRLPTYGLRAPPNIFTPAPSTVAAQRAMLKVGGTLKVDLLRRVVPIVKMPDGFRALDKDRTESPIDAQQYVEAQFGEHFDQTCKAMFALSRSILAPELSRKAYRLYQHFHPTLPEGKRVAMNNPMILDIERIQSLSA